MQFILNDKIIKTELHPAFLLLDFIRYEQNLKGTKIGCREGDCGACTVLIGEIIDGEVKYKSATSCLTPIGNVIDKHVVSIEGINSENLNPIQQAMADEGATQCGFCTPGFVVSLTGFCIDKKTHTYDNAISAIDGNICRCTGYKSIERAAQKISTIMLEKNDNHSLSDLIEKKIIPSYFSTIKEQLLNLNNPIEELINPKHKFIGGGTDLYVQKPEKMTDEAAYFSTHHDDLKGIVFTDSEIIMNGACTVSELIESVEFNAYFPSFAQHSKLVSSTPIRNIATIAGNIINASPIGDFTIFFLALNAQILLSDGVENRKIALKNFYKGYKQLDKNENEFIEKISIKIPTKNSLFNFEKVSKRTNLDIASVNAALSITLEQNTIVDATIAVGGVGPIPMFLPKTSAFLIGKSINENLILEANDIAQMEISPISDTRGSSEYKRLLVRQLIIAHFNKLFPTLSVEKLICAL
jgi:xanthine dehydrogenase small subunit